MSDTVAVNVFLLTTVDRRITLLRSSDNQLSRVYTRYMKPDTSIPDEQLVSVYISTDTCSRIQVLSSVLLADTSGYMDTCSRDDNFVADTGYSVDGDKDTSGYNW